VSIGDRAFVYNNLSNINLPDSLVSIGFGAFYSNQITGIVFPKSLVSIGDKAFSDNKLASITFSNSLVSIGAEVFSRNKLTSLSLPDSLVSIGNDAFSGNQLTSVTFPASLVSIGNRAFASNKLASISLPYSIAEIERAAFYHNQLSRVLIPETCKSHDEAFDVYVEIFRLQASHDRVVDNDGLLKAEQKAELIKMADSISTAYNFDLVIVTERIIGNKTPMEYADDFFDYNGYGLGENKDGCLLLQVTGIRKYWFSTTGRGITLLDDNDYAFDKLEANVVKNLKADNYYEAYRAFLSDMEEFLNLEAQGKKYTRAYVAGIKTEAFINKYFYQPRFYWFMFFTLIALVLSLITSLKIVSSWKKTMNTALLKTEAGFYVMPGSVIFRNTSESLIYSTTTYTEREEKESNSDSYWSDDSSSDSDSGSSRHESSSGTTHGGRGGDY
jgi:uncharacterized membrane protein YgcG